MPTIRENTSHNNESVLENVVTPSTVIDDVIRDIESISAIEEHPIGEEYTNERGYDVMIITDGSVQRSDEVSYCERTDEWVLTEDAQWVESLGEYVTQEDFNENFFTCDRCGAVLHNEDYGDDGLCQACIDHQNEEDDEEESHEQPNLNTEGSEHINEEEGEVITSKRTFGVELEMFSHSSSRDLRNTISDDYGLTHDGSICPTNGENAIELVSPILKGKAGEESLRKVVKKVNDLEYEVNNSCGFHVHLGASDFLPKKEFKMSTWKQHRDMVRRSSQMTSEGLIILPEHLKRVRCLFTVLNCPYSYNANMPESQLSTNWKAVIDYFKNATVEVLQKFLKNEVSVTAKGTEYRVGMSIDNNQTGYYKITIYTLKELEKRAEEQKALESKLQSAQAETQKARNTYNAIDSRLYQGRHSITSKEKWELKKALDKAHTEYVKADMLEGTIRQELENFKVGKVTDNKVIAFYEKTDIQALKTLMAFHVVFDKVFFAMLPESRHKSSRYCMPLSKRLSIEDISGCNKLDDLEKLWYKSTKTYDINSRKESKYDSSRYYGLNLHILFSKKATAEMRYHSGTTNIDKILNWVALHQRILDMIQKQDISLDQIGDCQYEYMLPELISRFINILRFGTSKRDKDLKAYIISRIKFFTGIDMLHYKRQKWTNTDK